MKAGGEDFNSLSRRFYIIVLIGLFYGLISAFIMYVAGDLSTVLLAAALTLASIHLLNRFLHLDGLSDLGDGLVCGGDAERKLAAMKDSKTGAGGVGYVMVFTILAFAALASLYGWYLVLLPIIVEIMCKNAVVACAAEGRSRQGLASAFVSNTEDKHLLYSLVLSIVLSVGTLLLIGRIFPGEFGWEIGFVTILVVIAAGVSTSVGIYMSAVAERNFGCVNGDVLGATNEIVRPIMYFILLVVLPWIP